MTTDQWLPYDAPEVWPIGAKLSDKLEFLRRRASYMAKQEGLSHDIAGYLHTVVFELAQAVIRAKESEGIHLVLTEVDHDAGTMKFEEEGKT